MQCVDISHMQEFDPSSAYLPSSKPKLEPPAHKPSALTLAQKHVCNFLTSIHQSIVMSLHQTRPCSDSLGEVHRATKAKFAFNFVTQCRLTYSQLLAEDGPFSQC